MIQSFLCISHFPVGHAGGRATHGAVAEVELRREQQSRATQEQLPRSGSFACFASRACTPKYRKTLARLLTNLAIKCLNAIFEATAANPEEIDLSIFQNIIRMGNEKGPLHSNWMAWRDYRLARSNGSHTYDGNKAEAVYHVAADFLDEAKYLYQKLVEKSL